MHIEQFFDVALAHASYAIISEKEVAIIDPARDPQPYYDFAAKHEAKITAVFETHPHADFVSSHAEIHRCTGATIYVSHLLGAEYEHHPVKEGDQVQVGAVRFHVLDTPGHSPDSITLLLYNSENKPYALFTGDTLFVGDVGRPDLRESVGNLTASRESLARAMYQTTRQKLMPLAPELLVYPAHGAGSLCGKALSEDRFSTLGREMRENQALQPMSEDEFVSWLLADQPMIPAYFGHDVVINKKGAIDFNVAVQSVPRLRPSDRPEANVLIIDTRPAEQFRANHLKGAINLMAGGKFETWLGSIVRPDERFYLIAESEQIREELIGRIAAIGYESLLAGAYVGLPEGLSVDSSLLSIEVFEQDPGNYTIIDVRNPGERATGCPFENSLFIPLPELRDRLNEIPTDKPVVVHCAAGYRSAAAASILLSRVPVPVYDLSENVKNYPLIK